MAVFDSRKRSEAEQSFYVVEDLRFQQNAVRPDVPVFNIYRYDSIEETIAKFKEVPGHMTPALGMHLSERSELDLVHRREGEPVLVTDFRNLPRWRTDANVLFAIDRLCEDLNIEWQMNSKLIDRGTVLVPLERNLNRVPDKVFDDKSLAVKKPSFYMNNPNPLSAINEAFEEGRGWMPGSEVVEAAQSFGYQNPKLLKIKQFNINYVDVHGHRGQADMSPYDLEILEERYAICYGNKHTRDVALRKLAEELDEFGEDFDYYDYHDGIEDSEEHIESLVAELSEGKVDDIVTYLREIAEDNEEFSARALNLASRIQGVVGPERKSSLESKIKDAEQKTGAVQSNAPVKENER